MYSQRKMMLIAGIALIVGAIAGTMVGFELSSRFWRRKYLPRAEESRGSLVPGDTTFLVYERLQSYRREHPPSVRTNSVTTH